MIDIKFFFLTYNVKFSKFFAVKICILGMRGG